MSCMCYFSRYFDGLVQDCSNSIANALEFLQSCTKQSVYCTSVYSMTMQNIHMHVCCVAMTMITDENWYICHGDNITTTVWYDDNYDDGNVYKRRIIILIPIKRAVMILQLIRTRVQNIYTAYIRRMYHGRYKNTWHIIYLLHNYLFWK